MTFVFLLARVLEVQKLLEAGKRQELIFDTAVTKRAPNSITLLVAKTAGAFTNAVNGNDNFLVHDLHLSFPGLVQLVKTLLLSERRQTSNIKGLKN